MKPSDVYNVEQRLTRARLVGSLHCYIGYFEYSPIGDWIDTLNEPEKAFLAAYVERNQPGWLGDEDTHFKPEVLTLDDVTIFMGDVITAFQSIGASATMATEQIGIALQGAFRQFVPIINSGVEEMRFITSRNNIQFFLESCRVPEHPAYRLARAIPDWALLDVTWWRVRHCHQGHWWQRLRPLRYLPKDDEGGL